MLFLQKFNRNFAPYNSEVLFPNAVTSQNVASLHQFRINLWSLIAMDLRTYEGFGELVPLILAGGIFSFIACMAMQITFWSSPRLRREHNMIMIMIITSIDL
jgi:hypothetical protein